MQSLTASLRLGVDDHVGDLGQLLAQPLLDLARARVRVGERRCRVEPEREERDEPLVRAQEAQLPRRAAGRPRARSARPRRVGELDRRRSPRRAARGASAPTSTSGTAAQIARSTSSATSCASSSGSSPGSFRCSESSVRAADVDEAQVVDLADPRDRERRGVGALAQRRVVVARLDVDDDVAAGQRPLDARPRPGRRAACPWPTAAPGETRDDDVGEVPPPACRSRRREARPAARRPRSPAGPPPPHRPARGPSARRRCAGSAGRPRASTSAATKSAAIESPSG